VEKNGIFVLILGKIDKREKSNIHHGGVFDDGSHPPTRVGQVL